MTVIATHDLALLLLTAAIQRVCPSLMECVRVNLSIETAFECGTCRELEAIAQDLMQRGIRSRDRAQRNAYSAATDYVWKKFYPKLGNAANDGQAA